MPIIAVQKQGAFQVGQDADPELGKIEKLALVATYKMQVQAALEKAGVDRILVTGDIFFALRSEQIGDVMRWPEKSENHFLFKPRERTGAIKEGESGEAILIDGSIPVRYESNHGIWKFRIEDNYKVGRVFSYKMADNQSYTLNWEIPEELQGIWRKVGSEADTGETNAFVMLPEIQYITKNGKKYEHLMQYKTATKSGPIFNDITFNCLNIDNLLGTSVKCITKKLQLRQDADLRYIITWDDSEWIHTKEQPKRPTQSGSVASNVEQGATPWFQMPDAAPAGDDKDKAKKNGRRMVGAGLVVAFVVLGYAVARKHKLIKKRK